MYRTIFFIGTLFLFFQCKNKNIDFIKNQPILETITKSSAVLDSTISEEQTLQDRTIWQRPYEIIDLLGPLENKVIADIGAGSGYFSFKFIHSAKKVIAIEIEQKLVDLMNEEKNYYKPEVKSKFEARLATTTDPNLKAQEVDIIFISNTYCYLTNRVHYLRNLKPKMKSKGQIMIVDFKKKITPIGPDLKNRLAQGDVETELIKAGYHIDLSDDTKLKYQFIIIASIKSE